MLFESENILTVDGLDFRAQEKRIIRTKIDGLLLVKRDFNSDSRGGLQEHFRYDDLWEAIDEEPRGNKQGQGSWSTAGVLRGMHAGPENKFVFPLMGVFYAAIVDVRKNSATFGQSVVLKLDNSKPWEREAYGYFARRGLANGFYVHEATGPHGYAYYGYEVTGVYDPLTTSKGFRYDDPTVNIDWPAEVKDAIVSEKDLNQTSFINFTNTVNQKMYE